ncbi:hypothetical protein PVK06_007143 [Gossypium arboreum]|uniref:Uncharacterized protein n=1 Tax=Gossypium arboreum TaxID=29729 RepID=A0ABR0QHB3_GOSAR|nr:hypothetical protein PVK06_007143 [Gossypium arboreum]
MTKAESFFELDPMKGKFESSKHNGKGNGERNHEKDKEGHSDDGNSIDITNGNRKHEICEKLGLSIRKSNKKIKTINSEEAPTMRVARNVELQIDEWKGNEKFEVGIKMLSSIQLVKYVSYRRNIDSIEQNTTKAPSKKLVEHEIDMRLVESTVEPPLREIWVVYRTLRGKKRYKNSRRGLFKILKQGGRVTMGDTKPRCENQWDSNGNKSKLGQVKAKTSCQRNILASAMAQVKRRRKPRQRFRKKGRPDRKTSQGGAKVTREFKGESSQCHSEGAIKMLREWVGENVTGQSAKPVTMVQDVPYGGPTKYEKEQLDKADFSSNGKCLRPTKANKQLFALMERQDFPLERRIYLVLYGNDGLPRLQACLEHERKWESNKSEIMSLYRFGLIGESVMHMQDGRCWQCSFTELRLGKKHE